MEGLLKGFHRLTDQVLLTTLKEEVRRERHITLEVLLLLIVVEQRRLHVDRYSSLFAYCTDQLKYSHSAAGRRIAGARCLRDYPRAWPMLLDGRLNLTTLCILARVITPENADELLDRAAGATQRQVEDIAAQFGAPKPVRDRIRPVRTLRRSPRPSSNRNGKSWGPQAAVGASPEAGSDTETSSGTAAPTRAAGGGPDVASRAPGSAGEVGLGAGSGTGPETGPETRAGTATQAGPEKGPGTGPGLSGTDAPWRTMESFGAEAESGAGAGSGSNPGTGFGSGPAGSSPTGEGFGTVGSRAAAGSEGTGFGSGAGVLVGSAGNATGTTAEPHSDESEGGDDSSADSARRDAKDDPVTYEITFRADAAFVEKLRRLQAILSTDPNPPLAPIFDRAIELALDKHDPERRHARRQARAKRKQQDERSSVESAEYLHRTGKSEQASQDMGTRAAPASACDGGSMRTPGAESIGSRSSASATGFNGSPANAASATGKSASVLPWRPASRRVIPRRRIPQWVRDLVLARDGHRCTYVGPDGRCPARHGLEIEHMCPHAKGGSDDIDNLRTFCREHNQRAAEIVFGVEFIRRCREEFISAG